MVGTALIGDGGRAIGRDTAEDPAASLVAAAKVGGGIFDGRLGSELLRKNAGGFSLLGDGGALPCTCKLATVW